MTDPKDLMPNVVFSSGDEFIKNILPRVGEFPSVGEFILLAPFIASRPNWQRDPLAAQITSKAARVAYERDGNPLHVWSAYCAVRELGQPVPDWILAYFDRCAVALLNLAGSDNFTGRARDGERVTKPSTAIAQAFEMKRPGRSGRGSVFSEFTNKTWLLRGATVEMYMGHGDKEIFAIEEVARQNGVSETTVRRDFKKYKTFTKSPTS